MRLGFVTSVKLGLSCMEALYEVGGHLQLAVTLHDHQATNKSGRIYLDTFCERHSIPLVKVRNINDRDAVDRLKRAQLDWLFIIGWSQIARRELLDIPARGTLGMHPTLLPEGRGRAAIPWAILKGLERTGVTLFKLDDGVDTGDILEQVVIPMHARTDATELYAKVEDAHVVLMKKVIPPLLAGQVHLRPQNESQASVWPGRKPEDGRIDLDGSVYTAERLVRAVTKPYPGAFAHWQGQLITIWHAELVPHGEALGPNPCLSFRDGVLRCIDWESREQT